MSNINPGDVVRVSTDTGFKNAAGAAADPTTVSFHWKASGGTETVWIYGTNSQVVKDGVGLYHADIPVVAVGLHYFRWVGTGNVAAAEEGFFSSASYF